MSNSRLTYIDKAKGLAILLMIFAHVTPGEMISTWIFAFHMPLFFIVSGILIDKRYMGGVITSSDIIKDILRRLYQLGIPYMVFTLLLTLFYGILQYISGGDMHVIYSYLFKIVTLQGIDSLWFIPCYFVAEIIMKFTLCVSKLIYIGSVVLISICLLFFLDYDMPFVWWWRLLMKFCICYTFVYVGYYISRYKIVEHMKKQYAIIIFIVASCLALYNGFSAIGSLSLNNPMLYYFNAICLTISVFFFFKICKAKILSIFSFWGKNSIVLLCTNNLIIEVVRFLDYRFTDNFLLLHGLFGSVIFLFIIIVIEIPIIKLVENTRLAILFGK